VTSLSHHDEVLWPVELSSTSGAGDALGEAAQTGSTADFGGCVSGDLLRSAAVGPSCGCSHLSGPFFHGTRVALQVGDGLVPGRVSNFHRGRVVNGIYFTALLETAAWERGWLRRWLAGTSAVSSTR
jgi:hypothetical protein